MGHAAPDDPAREYDARSAREDAARAAHDLVSRRLSRWRLAVAAAVVASGGLATLGGPTGAWGCVAAGALAFVLIALRHARVDEAAAAAARRAALNRDAAARRRRQWDLVEDWGQAAAPVVDPAHPYAFDLDLVGHASLWRLLGRARTGPGDERLAAWALEPAGPDESRDRRQAAQALAPALDWRQQVAAAALRTRDMRAHELARFLDWCEGEGWLRRRPWLYVAALLLALASPTLIALEAWGLSGGGWAATLATAALLSIAVQRPLARTLEDASWVAALRGWRALAAEVADMPGTDRSARLAALRARLTAGEAPAARALDRIDRILGFAGVRHTPVLHWPLQVLTLWDFHVWWALERWQRRHGRQLRGWLEAIAEAEALAALAGLAHDHPDWAWPEVASGESRLLATAVAHPLLPQDRAVPNDVTLGPPGRLLLVTGSNMSGKSTLLRAIGLNAVLAQMGAPVAAAAWTMPPLAPVTSMRLQDSLEDGVSYFMASLQRLRLVVDHARAASRDAAAPLSLYLLDELLGGTNTAEREQAVRGVVRHLASCRAIGALTTHDLALAETPELRAHADCVHFRETIDGEGAAPQMRFDYRLRPGVATSRNALALMRAVGLGDLV